MAPARACVYSPPLPSRSSSSTLSRRAGGASTSLASSRATGSSPPLAEPGTTGGGLTCSFSGTVLVGEVFSLGSMAGRSDGMPFSPPPPTPPDLSCTTSLTLPLRLAVRSLARLARRRKRRAKQVSQPPGEYSPYQPPSWAWLARRISAPQLYQSLPPMVSRP